MIEDRANIEALMEQVISKKPDLLEVRLDKLHEHRLLKEIAEKKSFPLIATDRSARSQRRKIEALSFAVSSGFDLVDLEFTEATTADVKQLKTEGADVILSFHDYSQTPRKEGLTKILGAEKKLGGDICKLVTTARGPHDNLTILSFVESEALDAKVVAFAMGRDGVPSRVLSPLFGAEFTFAALTEDSKTAEGQLSIDALRSAWQILGLH
jgi:3-dehydroquinate dehydratase type I